MDGLALLCTLHADGPATLKRLRGAGCANLSALLERSAADVAEVLDVAPAAARRLLREARLLAERVGPELEAEETPVPAALASGPTPLTLELPPVPPQSSLDRSDRDLLARIVGAPGPAPRVPMPLERIGLDLGAESPWPAAPPEALPAHASMRAESEALSKALSDGPFEARLRDLETRPPHGDSPDGQQRATRTGEPLPSAAQAPGPGCSRGPEAGDRERLDGGVDASSTSTPDLAPLLALDGIDAALAATLANAGYADVAALAGADALAVQRALGVPLARAKRLTFVARRARSAAAAADSAPGGPATAREGLRAAASATAPAAGSPAGSPAGPPLERAAGAPRWRLTPTSEPLAPAPDPSDVPPPAERAAPRPAAAPAQQVRPRFWEPRSAPPPAAGPAREPQGVPVDPAEIERPRRFTEARRAAAQPGGATPAPHLTAPGAGSAAGPVAGAAPRANGTTLGWNFEVPRPQHEPVEDALPRRGAPAPQPGAGVPAPRRTWLPVESDESSAGPFA